MKDVCLGTTLGAALDVKGLLWTWGSNTQGELGVGDTDPRVHPYPVLQLKGKKVENIACGGSFVIALGGNVKKPIPELKLKENETKTRTTAKSGGRFYNATMEDTQQSQITKRSRSLSKSKILGDSSKKDLRKNSVTSISKVYGGEVGSSDRKKQSKVTKKKSIKTSQGKSDVPKNKKSVIRIIKQKSIAKAGRFVEDSSVNVGGSSALD